MGWGTSKAKGYGLHWIEVKLDPMFEKCTPNNSTFGVAKPHRSIKRAQFKFESRKL
jgi:hypothetical protein